ncbi:Aste57867_8957 [Aphanomyces stellatus]|uniref:Aste57867_8957 protein n=1 Tax=Aphanomyces stellatus TaxID=120398 RepID=A0A485KLT6_9STRA|nr:hypothetical protein As57867_008922 [Aphanomyces stellatus]VFT85841.1 Aste57867_8957 [Aphanomyces stellatus]
MADKPYRSVVDSIMYLMISTRPRLAFVVQQSQFLTNPGPAYWQAARRALRYIRGTIDYGLVLVGDHDIATPLHAYADSDYANCVDTRRCVGGFVTFYDNSEISWVAKRLRCVVLSTTEAELMILCSLAQECLYILQTAGDMGRTITAVIPLYEDNHSTIQILNNSGPMDAQNTSMCVTILSMISSNNKRCMSSTLILDTKSRISLPNNLSPRRSVFCEVK